MKIRVAQQDSAFLENQEFTPTNPQDRRDGLDVSPWSGQYGCSDRFLPQFRVKPNQGNTLCPLFKKVVMTRFGKDTVLVAMCFKETY